MSRNRLQLKQPTEILGVVCNSIVYGGDHALGFFIQGYDQNGECILDRDGMGCSLVPCPNGLIPLTTKEYYDAVLLAHQNSIIIG